MTTSCKKCYFFDDSECTIEHYGYCYLSGIGIPKREDDEACEKWIHKRKYKCNKCRWYHSENNSCQLKKCTSNGGCGAVTKKESANCECFRWKEEKKWENLTSYE